MITNETKEALEKYMKGTTRRLNEKYGERGELILHAAMALSILQQLPNFLYGQNEKEIAILSGFREQLATVVCHLTNTALGREKTFTEDTAREVWAEMELYIRERNAALSKGDPNYTPPEGGMEIH